jgi:hypothetical protein
MIRAFLMGCYHRPEDAVLEELARTVGRGPLLDRLGELDGTVLEGGKNMTQTERLAIGSPPAITQKIARAQS